MKHSTLHSQLDLQKLANAVIQRDLQKCFVASVKKYENKTMKREYKSCGRFHHPCASTESLGRSIQAMIQAQKHYMVQSRVR